MGATAQPRNTTQHNTHRESHGGLHVCLLNYSCDSQTPATAASPAAQDSRPSVAEGPQGSLISQAFSCIESQGQAQATKEHIHGTTFPTAHWQSSLLAEPNLFFRMWCRCGCCLGYQQAQAVWVGPVLVLGFTQAQSRPRRRNPAGVGSLAATYVFRHWPMQLLSPPQPRKSHHTHRVTTSSSTAATSKPLR